MNFALFTYMHLLYIYFRKYILLAGDLSVVVWISVNILEEVFV